MKNIAIIFAGGTGQRMGAGLPKQFIEVYGKPIIIHTLDIFEECESIDEIYIACKADYINKLNKLIKRFDISKVKKVVPGGNTGQDSIYNACKAAYENNDHAFVLIHDGVRPCIDSDLIKQNIKMAEEKGNAVTCTAMYETPIVSTGGLAVEDTPPRKDYYTAQAPQTFEISEVIAAHEEIRKTNPGYDGIIDTCTLMKHLGKTVNILPGARGNIKLTTPEDLYIFKAMLDYRTTEHALGI